MVPLPDQYRGQHHYSDEEASVKYAEAVKSRLAKLEDEGRRLAAFICEPYFVESGVHPPTSQYYQEVYSAVRAHGGLVIADEVSTRFVLSLIIHDIHSQSRTGLGRTGEHMWGFQSFGVVPDIVTIGRSMSNGYPMGAVICSRYATADLSKKAPFNFLSSPGRCLSDWVDTSPHLVEIQSPAPLDSLSLR